MATSLPELSPAIFSGYTLSFVESLTRLYDDLEDIDCESYARLISTVLTLHGINHNYCGGACTFHPVDGSAPLGVNPHFWVELCSEQEEIWIADYRLKHNLPSDVQPPHGIFRPDSRGVSYVGKAGGMLSMSPEWVAMTARGFVMGSPPEMRSQVRAMKQKCAGSWNTA